MDYLHGALLDVIEKLPHFLLQTLPTWVMEHYLWLIVIIPLVGAIVLVKYLWP